MALIPNFYAGKSVFITGGTGFMGKVLIERLLSTCPEIGHVYLLMREKKEALPEKRLMHLKQCQVFEKLRATHPEQLEKLIAVPGDVMVPDLGLSNESIGILQEVSLVFHVAATVKFNEPLELAVRQNIFSVIDLLKICDTLPNIEGLVHVSTAYCNPEHKVNEEVVYPTSVDLDQLLTLTETLSPELLKMITPEYIKPKPNTYTFTKGMAETALQRHGVTTYPIAIVRPTIVISAKRHPHPGWVDSLNGPSGVILAASKGLLHVFQCVATARTDMIPVDIAVETMIAVGWELALDKPKDIRVYNCSTHENYLTWGTFEKHLRQNIFRYPMHDALWHPFGVVTQNQFVAHFVEWSTQTLPLCVAEFFTKLFGHKSRFRTLNNLLHGLRLSLRYFTLHEWQFPNTNVQRLRSRLQPEDLAIYNIDPRTIDWEEHFSDFHSGVQKYILKEQDVGSEKAHRHARRMYIVHIAFAVFLAILLFFLVTTTTRNMFTIITNSAIPSLR